MAKKNTNCLEGFICPNPGCGHTAKFNITCTVNVDFTDEGEDDHGGFEWEDTSECVCSECGHTATVKEFRTLVDDEEETESERQQHENEAQADKDLAEREGDET